MTYRPHFSSSVNIDEESHVVCSCAIMCNVSYFCDDDYEKSSGIGSVGCIRCHVRCDKSVLLVASFAFYLVGKNIRNFLNVDEQTEYDLSLLSAYDRDQRFECGVLQCNVHF